MFSTSARIGTRSGRIRSCATFHTRTKGSVAITHILIGGIRDIYKTLLYGTLLISVLRFGVLLRVRAAILFGGSREEAVSFAGESDPNYRGPKEETECEICGEALKYYPSDEEGVYCSDCVQLENWRHRPAVTGENNPHWNGGKRENANYGSGWNAVREPDVHHLVPVRAFGAARLTDLSAGFGRRQSRRNGRYARSRREPRCSRR